jgi:putative transposase
MPWSETTTMEQKIQFIRDWRRGAMTVSDLCFVYGISRKTGYKWIERYVEEGPDGLICRSQSARVIPHKTTFEVEQAILAMRLRHPTWGAKKLLPTLEGRYPQMELPSRTTVCEILSRNGLVHSKPKRRAVGHPGKPTKHIELPNDCWSIDFKGQFRLKGAGPYCYPLTMTDNYSRFLLCCQSQKGVTIEESKETLTKLFREYGLPVRIRSDNGSPFGARTLGRLTKLSAWWIRLGVMPEFIEPGKPQQNGKHERMHKTLKAEATKPPAGSMAAQQRKFNAFMQEFNYERPHEALDMKTPSQLYKPSARAMPDKLAELEYPDRFEVRYVSANGGIRWGGRWLNISQALVDQYVGLEEIDDGQWDVYFGPLRLGRLHENLMTIEPTFDSISSRV